MNKKISSLLLAGILLVTSVNTYAYEKTSDETIQISTNATENITSKNITNLQINSKNLSNNDKRCCFVLATTDYNGKVINYVTSEEIIDANDETTMSSYAKILPNGYKLKALVWDNLQNKNVISNVIDIKIDGGYIEEEIISTVQEEVTIPQWSEFQLPQRVKVKMNSGEYKDVLVNWNENSVNTDVPKKIEITGNVVGYNNEEVTLIINVSAYVKIRSIDNLSFEIEQNDNFKLPSSVIATMSNDDKKVFNIAWNKNEVDTSIIGTQEFEGIVRGYDKKIKLTLKINSYSPDDVVEFANEEIYEIVCDLLGKKSDDKISKSELLQVNELDFTYGFYSGNYNLQDLKYFKNLEYLSLNSGSYNYDLSPLRTLTNLVELDLYGNEISDITPLESLDKLEKLNLISNNIRDISPIKNLTALTSLKLDKDKINDLSCTVKFYDNLTEKNFDCTFYKTDADGVINIEANDGDKIKLPLGIKTNNNNATFVDWDKDIITVEGGKTIDIAGKTNENENVIFRCKGIDTGEAEDVVIHFADENLEKAVRKAIDKIKGEIYASDVKNLKTLDAVALGISNLSGIEYCKGLEKLGLWGNRVTQNELTKIKDLRNLKFLDLAANKITYVPKNSFENMSNLFELVLDENPITEIDENALVGLDNLNNILVEETSISNIKFLKPLKNIKSVLIRYNNIYDVSVLKELKTMEELWASNNNISNISSLSEHTNLTWVDLEQNNISDISALLKCKDMIKLNICSNKVSDISALTDMVKLEWFEAHDNQISDITPLTKLTKLSILNLANNNVSNITALKNTVNLTQLYLKNNKITDYSPIEDYYYNIKRTDFDLV